MRVYGSLLSMRTTDVSGFDLRAFNAFRNNSATHCDVDHVNATDLHGTHAPALLSAPVLLYDLHLGGPVDTFAAIPEAVDERRVHVAATRAGVLNAVVFWASYDLAPSTRAATSAPLTVDLGPSRPGEAARPFSVRARRQQVHYVGYERTLRAGKRVELLARRSEVSLELDAPADAAPHASLERWPVVSVLAYHFPMIADEGRNGAFDRALRRAVRSSARPPHVLDIGAGSGLLSMMAARAGAARVSALEMVPALAATAKHIVGANGYDGVISVVAGKSHDVSAADLGGRADILVCEIVDNMLLGEGVLSSVEDARRRLLTPAAPIIPRGGTLYALPVELRAPRRCNFDLGELNVFHTDQGFAPRGRASVKLQELPETDWRALAPPIEVFRFDWASAPLDEICKPRHNPSLLARIKDDGVLNAFVVYFRLHLDDDDAFDTGPANPKLVAWDQAPPGPSPPTYLRLFASVPHPWPLTGAASRLRRRCATFRRSCACVAGWHCA